MRLEPAALTPSSDDSRYPQTLETLEMIPFKWENTKKVTLNARELLGPLQSLQQDKVREYTDEFRTRASEFAKRFHEEAPFSWGDGSSDAAYKTMTQFHLDLCGLEEEGARVNQQQELFEVTDAHHACRREALVQSLIVNRRPSCKYDAHHACKREALVQSLIVDRMRGDAFGSLPR